jgi:hypothetical protein
MQNPPKSFKFWQSQDLYYHFDLNRIKRPEWLQEWLEAEETITDSEKNTLDLLRIELEDNATFWNEEELKMRFVSILMRLVNLDGPNFRAFYDRNITAIVNDIKLTGTADMLVATGFQKPTEPYFFLHEFKPEARLDADPAGQVLSEMLAAQALNKTTQTIYGCYVLGRNWFFVVLKGKEYAVSDAFAATQEDIYRIFQILRRVKKYIMVFTGNATSI